MYTVAYRDPRGRHNRLSVNQNFFKTWSSKMAYILGFIFADGAIEDVQKSSRTCYLAISSCDLSILEKIRTAMNSVHQISKRYPQIHTYTNGKQYTSKLQFHLRIGSKKIYNDLLKLGVTPRKSLTIPFPYIPIDYLPFFVRGYFGGDGSVFFTAYLRTKDKRQQKDLRSNFTSGNEAFLISLRNLLTKVLGLSSRKICSYGTGNQWKLEYASGDTRKLLRFMYYPDCRLFLDRKAAYLNTF